MLSGISGALDDYHCYAINLPTESENLKIRTSNGSGDCDLGFIYSRSPFDNYSSDGYGNEEKITVSAPRPGIWYVALLGWDAYPVVTLSVSYDYSNDIIPIANFSANVFAGVSPLTVSFIDQFAGSITSWLWDFGDGSTSDDRNVVHTFITPGSYTIKLKVAGPG